MIIANSKWNYTRNKCFLYSDTFNIKFHNYSSFKITSTNSLNAP